MMEGSKKVLVTATKYSELCAQAKQLLESNGCVVIENKLDRPFFTFEELEQIIPDVDAAIIGLDTWDEAIFKIAPKLKVVSKFGVGIDNIDVVKANEYGIKVTNAPAANSNAVAELAVCLMLNALRSIPQQHQKIKEGQWDRLVGREICGRNVGLVGFGNIAQLVAGKLQGFEVNLYACDKYPNMLKAQQLGVKMVSFEELLQNCDIVSLHVPSLKETYHMMGHKHFALMKDGAYFINTARGVLVDETALYEALQSGKLTGAAIDVFEQEPISSENPLLRLNNLIMTPHTAAETYEVYQKVSLITARATLDVLAGRTPEHLICVDVAKA
jgi:D-3-phosphoglycerate dehydrogenase / 2-oxoglutarate reductase